MKNKNRTKISQTRMLYQSGITLIEIMVVVAIVVIISIIAVYQFSSSNKISHIRTTADDMALNIRKAQSYALAVKSTSSFLRPYQNGYGVHFETGLNSNPQDANQNSYIIFTDYELAIGPGGWDRAYLKSSAIGTPCGSPSQNDNECLEKINMPAGDKITTIEVCYTTSGTTSCSSVSSMDIVFLRPNLDAYFCTIAPSLGGCSSYSQSSGLTKVTLTSGNRTKVINVWSTGQIEIK